MTSIRVMINLSIKCLSSKRFLMLGYFLQIHHMLITTKFNLVELYYHFLHDYNKDVADKYFEVYSKILVPITNSCIKTAMEFKLKYKKEKVSYVDCIGHALAKELGIKFLTGDQKFKDKENVEFVK